MKILKNIFFPAIFALVASTTASMRAAHEKNAAAIAQEEACKIVERLLVGRKILGDRKVDDILGSSSLKAELKLLLNQRDKDIAELRTLINRGRVEIKQCGLNSFGDVLTEDELRIMEELVADSGRSITQGSFEYGIDSNVILHSKK